MKNFYGLNIMTSQEDLRSILKDGDEVLVAENSIIYLYSVLHVAGEKIIAQIRHCTDLNNCVYCHDAFENYKYGLGALELLIFDSEVRFYVVNGEYYYTDGYLSHCFNMEWNAAIQAFTNVHTKEVEDDFPF